MLVVKQQVNKPLLIPDLGGLVFWQTIAVPSSGSQILLSVRPVKGEGELDNWICVTTKCTGDRNACAGACARMC